MKTVTTSSNEQILNVDGMEVEFIKGGKTRKVDFDDYHSSDNHSNGFSTGYVSALTSLELNGQWMPTPLTVV